MTDFEVVSSLAFARPSNAAIITLCDGRRVGRVLSNPIFEESSRLVYLHAALRDGLLVAFTDQNDHVAVELALDGGDGRLGNRLVVYLDQNHFSKVSKAESPDSGVSNADRDAARRLKDWAARGLIICPISAAHVYETGKWDSAQRYKLALSLLDLSGGWQVRDPLQVRRDELLSLLAKISGDEQKPGPRVITLKPEALFAARQVDYRPPPDIFGSSLGRLFEVLLSAIVTIDQLLDIDTVEPGTRGRWVSSIQDFHDRLNKQDMTQGVRGRVIDAYILRDLLQDVAEAAAALELPTTVLSEWITKRGLRDFRGLPSLGLWREMLRDRLGNTRGRRWNDNDLHDMVYLACAAGYSDFVVCERPAAGDLGQGLKRLNRDCRIFGRLNEAVDAIGSVLEGAGAPNVWSVPGDSN